MSDCNRGQDYFSVQQHEAPTAADKYGGLAPKKKPLISKDHERAYFDSADWALCKQGAGVSPKSTAAVETLQPKLQRTPHQQLPPRRPACTTSGQPDQCDNLQRTPHQQLPPRRPACTTSGHDSHGA